MEMRVIASSQVPAEPVKEGGARGASVRWLIARPEGAPTFAMRLFELAPGGSTPLHEHDWEHEVYILEGEAEVMSDAGPRPVSEGDAVLVMPGERHQFRNLDDEPAKFLCMIPLPDED
jgi:quercetin dioxygenase-like cupin family protein